MHFFFRIFLGGWGLGVFCIDLCGVLEGFFGSKRIRKIKNTPINKIMLCYDYAHMLIVVALLVVNFSVVWS